MSAWQGMFASRGSRVPSVFGCLSVVSPRTADTGASASPPFVEVAMPPGRVMRRFVHHSAQPAEEVGVDELAGTPPLEVLVIQRVVLVEQLKVVGQLFRGGEVVHVDERMLRCVFLVVLSRSTHHYRKNLRTEPRQFTLDSALSQQTPQNDYLSALT